jgi:hypothetical protein
VHDREKQGTREWWNDEKINKEPLITTTMILILTTSALFENLVNMPGVHSDVTFYQVFE